MRIALLLSLTIPAGCRMFDGMEDSAFNLVATTVVGQIFSLQIANPLPQRSVKPSIEAPSTPGNIQSRMATLPSNQQVRRAQAIAACIRTRRALIERATPSALAAQAIQSRIARCKLAAAKVHEEIIVIDSL